MPIEGEGAWLYPYRGGAIAVKRVEDAMERHGRGAEGGDLGDSEGYWAELVDTGLNWFKLG